MLHISTCANIEGQWALKGNKLISLSPEQLVDCDGSQDATKLVQIHFMVINLATGIYSGNADCGVFGGWPYLAYQYISKAVSCGSREIKLT